MSDELQEALQFVFDELEHTCVDGDCTTAVNDCLRCRGKQDARGVIAAALKARDEQIITLGQKLSRVVRERDNALECLRAAMNGVKPTQNERKNLRLRANRLLAALDSARPTRSKHLPI